VLDISILQLPTREGRVAAVRGAIIGAMEAGTFTYTELMLQDEALQTMAFEVLDGVSTSPQNVPQYGAEKIYNVGPVRLVSIDGQPMKSSEWYEPRIPGTNLRAKPIKRVVDHGTDAVIDDTKDNGRQARRLLLKAGWPIRNIKSRSGSVGHIVEWRWLERAAAEPGATEEHREIQALYERLKGEAPKQTQPRAAKPVEARP